MTTTTEPTQYLTTIETSGLLADRVKAAKLDERHSELPAELWEALHADRTEENLERCVEWLERHPQVPAWLNLDAVLSPEDREAITASLHRVKRNLDTIRESAHGIRLSTMVVEEATVDLPDDVAAAVAAQTGVDELRQLAFDLRDLFESAAEATRTRDDVLERLDQIDSEDYGGSADDAIAIVEAVQS